MFWGLVLKANRKYTQTIKKAFHLSQAALDLTTCGNDPVQLVLISDKISYILCTLRKQSVEQVALDLNFAEGDEISFISQGNGSVHLSGYLVDEDYLGDEEEQMMLNALNPNKKSKKAKKETGAADSSEDGEEEDDGEDDSDDDADDDDENEGAEVENDESSDDDDDSDEESEQEEVKEPKAKQQKLDKPKQNGIDKQLSAKKDKKNKENAPKQQKGEKILQGGVKVEDVRVGNGPEAKAGKKISVYYEGRLKSNNKVFDSTKQGNGFKFALGNGDVIKAWDIGVVGMKVGGKRKITCPPNTAYGAKGSPPVIPPNSTLVFEVELKSVQ